MKGTLKNKEGKSVVEYVTHYKEVMEENNAKYSVEDSFITELPLHPDNHTDYVLDNNGYFNFYDGKEVEFEIIEKYVEPDDNIHCNRGADIKFAKLISKQEELPNESFNMLMKGSEQESWDEIETMLKSYISFSDLFEIMQEIKKKYNPPTKK